jgi:hypothetical protein
MIKLLIALFFSVGSVNSVSEADLSLSSPQTNTVYICYSSKAKKYHYSKTCRGLSACTHDIKSVSLTDAKTKFNRTLCGWED